MVEPDQEVLLDVHAEDEGGVDTSHVAVDVVGALVPDLLSAMTDLQPVLISGPTAVTRWLAVNGQTSTPNPLAVRGLDPEVDRRGGGFADVQQPSSGGLERGGQATVRGGAVAGDAVDRRVGVGGRESTAALPDQWLVARRSSAAPTGAQAVHRHL